LFTKAGMTVPAAGFVHVYLNDENCGAYLKVERIDEYYFSTHARPVTELTKVGFGSVFTFVNSTGTLDTFEKQIPDDGSLSFLTEFIHALDTVSTDNTMFETLGKRYLDIPQYLMFHAMTVAVNNTDGLCNNFYLYRSSSDAPYTVIAHDFDNAFAAGGQVSLDAANAIIVKLLKNDSCRAMYAADLDYIMNHVYAESELLQMVDDWSPKIVDQQSSRTSFDAAAYREAVQILKNEITSRRTVLHGAGYL
jgi:spore coat protein CotH